LLEPLIINNVKGNVVLTKTTIHPYAGIVRIRFRGYHLSRQLAAPLELWVQSYDDFAILPNILREKGKKGKKMNICYKKMCNFAT
jgi:hypothetical protein